MRRKAAELARFVIALVLFASPLASIEATDGIRGALLGQDQLEDLDASDFKQRGFDTAVLLATDQWTPSERDLSQLSKLEKQGIEWGIWIEIARDMALADQHPEWMASIQGHPEWRRFFPDFPRLKEGQVVKVYPWVPIAYREAFEAQLEKVKRILARWPAAKRVFLNDIQAAPSACGCGHPLCRWTTDYGPIKTATPLESDFSAKFVHAVEESREDIEVIPVWATECEEGDKPGLCAGVGCFRGACWREWTAQLEPLAVETRMMGALLLQKTFQRSDLDESWLAEIPKVFSEMPARYGRSGLAPSQIVAVVEGWMGEGDSWKKQRERLESAGVSSYVVAMTKIKQGWEPRLFDLPTE